MTSATSKAGVHPQVRWVVDPLVWWLNDVKREKPREIYVSVKKCVVYPPLDPLDHIGSRDVCWFCWQCLAIPGSNISENLRYRRFHAIIFNNTSLIFTGSFLAQAVQEALIVWGPFLQWLCSTPLWLKPLLKKQSVFHNLLCSKLTTNTNSEPLQVRNAN